MTRTQFETGFSRLYQAAWIILFFGVLFALVFSNRYDPIPGMVALAAAAIGPLVIGKLGKWIYRGFVPKD